jgi:flagellar FliL protein
MKAVTPLLLALVGLGAGLGAGIALKPAPEPDPLPVACAPDPGEAGGAEPDAHAGSAAGSDHGAALAQAPCAPAEADPFEPAEAEAHKTAEELAYVTMDKPFVVPVFEGEKVVAMVVLSVSVETDPHSAPLVEGVKPRLRDSFLAAMFRHANSGGFDGSFTSGRKIEDLKAALLQAARGVLVETPVDEVLITEIARQEV